MENGSKRNDEVGIDRNKYFSSTIENENLRSKFGCIS
jgi:hypothetical protein